MAYFNYRFFLITLVALAPVLLSVRLGKDNLAPSLSGQARVLYPGSDEFANASVRWSAAKSPAYSLIVKVATEADVQKTILYANQKGKSFLAVSGGHGTTSQIANAKGGIGIHLGRMNNISIVDDGEAALIEGGVQNGDLVSYLWARGKQTATTGCDCVGYIAPILGGGHGWLRGRYGLAADQLLSARLVLANGTVVEASEVENPDLFWALRGAGHNFGVVTQAKLRIYDVPPSERQWTASGFVFKEDKLEALFEVANEVLDDPERPAELTYYFVFAFNREVDAEQPIITLWVYYPSTRIPEKFDEQLRALIPVAVETSTTDLAGVNAHLLANKDGPACAEGLSRKLTPISLQHYPIPSIRRSFEIFANMPAALHDSVMFLENYPNDRVLEIDANSTAFPNRIGKILASPLMTYAPNASLDAVADGIIDDIRDALVKGSGSNLVAYINYAKGDESLEAVYGYEPWRLEKLRRLKKEFDPFGRFNFFAPIV
ncbi:hypothetical protein E8E13_007204 [Curvularia kusanoi]|uniref:FAD-binding PCMH-type domain-containing protein n=1 Tax=Curvularia kusanoi TaxID=90978 RepID=A0A9P4W901_CURKU|nr:hypothetical protein E8E13_007204 [Curvularia kusanoi]